MRGVLHHNAAVPDSRALMHLNQLQLARRWAMSPRTLERWRWMGEGPPYLKIGKRIVYRLDDVEAFEADRLITGLRRHDASGAPAGDDGR